MNQCIMKIAVIEPVGGHGGMDYYDFGLCGGLAEAGVDVVLYTCNETVIPKSTRFEVRHTYVDIYDKSPGWRRGLRYLRGTMSWLLRSLRECRHICHFHFFHIGPLQVFNIAMAKLLCRKVVITAHDVESFVESLEIPALSRWVYKVADRVIAHNQISKQELMSRIGVAASRITVIPHGNYLHVLSPLPMQADARSHLGIDLGAKVILFFGQIKHVKGLDLLLEAMPDLLRKHPDALLLIAGKPWKTDFSMYEKQMRRLKIRKNCVTHIRFIKDEELPNYYAAADLVVLPYRRIYQSGVLLMAMSYSKAVLVSDLPGMTEIVNDGDTGLVFNQGDVASLAEKLEEALTNTRVREHVAEQGFCKVRDNYGWDVIGAKCSEIYAQIE
jgi:D-inositol-3-phosphate glycosyltransferase